MMKVSEQLLEASAKIWEEYNKHPFVRSIEDGSLDKDKFRYYIIQDYLYLEDYARCFAIGIAKAKSLETTRLFSGYIGMLTGDEMDVHRGYMGRLGVTREEIENTPRALDNLSYTSYMLRVAYEEGEAEILAAILSCAYSYEVIAKRMLENNPKAASHPFYGSWVANYASPEYAAENRILLDTLDKLSFYYTNAQIKHLEEIFVACSKYELEFWNMGWEMRK